MESSSPSKGGMFMTNETLVKMTRPPHFNAKSTTPNGFRNMLPPLTNGKTIPQSGAKGSNGEHQPRRSVITLKTAPGPTVNSSGTGVLKSGPKVPSSDTDSKTLAAGRGPRSRKRSRDGDTMDSSDPSEKKDEQSMSASEIVEPTKRRRRGKGSRKLEKKNAQVPSSETAAAPRVRAVNSSSSAPGILDIYGLKSKAVDLSTYEIDIPLDKLLSGEFEMPASHVKNDPAADGECTNLIERHLNNVMELLPKRTSKFIDNASSVQEDVKVRLMLDLERPFQPEEEDGSCSTSQKMEDRSSVHRTSSLDKAKSKPFLVQTLPSYSCEEFRDRLRLPECDLETLIANARPSVSTEHPGTSADKSSTKFEGIPPSPASFSPVGVGESVRGPRNGRSSERHWDPDIRNRKAEDHKPEPSSLAKADRVKDELETGEGRDGNKAECSRDTEFPAQHHLRVRVDDSHHRHLASNLPASPCSPGVQAAAILLCDMANSDAEKEHKGGKRPRVYPGEPSHRFSKVSKLDEHNNGNEGGGGNASKASSKEVSTGSQAPSAKKAIGSEKRKSLSQVNHSLSKKPSVVPPAVQTSPVQSSRSFQGVSARNSSSKVGKSSGEVHHRDNNRDRDSSKDETRLSLPLAACKWGSQAAVKSKEVPQMVGKVKLVNGVTNSSSPKSSINNNNNGTTTSRSSPKILPSRNDNVSRSLSKCSESSATPPRSSSSPAGTALKSSRRTSSTTFGGEVKQQQRSKHDLRASKLSRECHR